MTEKEMTMENEEQMQETEQAAEHPEQPAVKEAAKEKTAEELALEQGYYACCFRSH